jgi:hypothetical protein
MAEITLQAMIDEIKGRGLGAANWLSRARNNEFRTTPEAIERKEESLVILRAIHENLKRQIDKSKELAPDDEDPLQERVGRWQVERT